MEPLLLGPTGLPKQTLGWELLAWTADYLHQPDGDSAGGPWRFTPEQARFVLWWYAIDDTGRFVYRNGVLRRMKGWGKDPLGAVLCALELCAPVRFDGWNAAGEPVGRPVAAPWVITAAVSRDQTRNTMRLFPSLLSDTCVDEYGLDIHHEIIHKQGGGQIESVTSSPRALEGARASFSLINESHHWLANNDGHEMYKVIVRNAVKTRSRHLQITNGHVPGEESVAEQAWEAYQKIQAGQARDSGMLYDSREAPPETDIHDEESLRQGLLAARGDATWLDVDGLIAEIHDIRNPLSVSRRFYLNQIVAAEDSWMAPHEWDRCWVDAELRPGDRVTLGFDGSRSDDSTVLMACRIDDGVLFRLAAWEHPAQVKDWEVPREDVDAHVRAAFERYRVQAMYADIAYWESYVDSWVADFGRRAKLKASPRSAFAFDMRARIRDFGLGCENFLEAVLNQHVRHDGDPLLRQHVLNAKRRVTKYDHIGIGKATRDSKRKIDAAVTAVLAWMARQEIVKTRRVGARKVVFHR